MGSTQGRMGGEGCIHDCRDPAWGGEGTCDTAAQPFTCLCDDGYASRDAIGNPNCVPRRMLVVGYAVLAVASFLTTAVLVWQANKFRHLPAAMGTSRRRALTRLRVLASSSVYAVGFGCISIALTAFEGDAGFYDAGFLQAEYGVLLPSVIFAVAMIAEFWVDSLPSQLLPPESVADRLKKTSQKYNVFVVCGGFTSGAISILGFLTLAFPTWPKRGADVVTLGGGLTSCLVVLFVAIRITLVINRSIKKASETSQAFYFRAKKNIWLQTVSLCSLAGVEAVLGIMKGVTSPSESAILWYIQILAVQAGVVVFALATNFRPPHGPGKLTASPSKILRTSNLSHQCQRRAFISGGAARFADMPLKHLVQVRIRRDDTDSDEDLSESTVYQTVPERRQEFHASRVSTFDGQGASGRRESNEFLPARGRRSYSHADASVEPGRAVGLPRGMVSALDNSPLADVGEEKNQADIDDQQPPSNSAPRCELEGFKRRSKGTLPPITVNKTPGYARCLVSTAGGVSSALGGAASLRVESGGSGSVMIGGQQEEVTDPRTRFTPRGWSDLSESNFVSSVLRAISGGGDVPATGKVVPIEPV